jgi:hypothetical protein
VRGAGCGGDRLGLLLFAPEVWKWNSNCPQVIAQSHAVAVDVAGA